ncbi:MAG: hypothetical protein KAJ75_06850 [Alphaproteobacteria bacterium]|nr:hypothetical protein [Alphaproteobacteria bacterium]
MADDVVSDSTGEDNTETDTAEDVKTEDTAEETATTPSGGDETSETSDDTEETDQKVPYSRFKEVNEAKTKAVKEAEVLREKLEKLEGGKTGAVNPNLTPQQQQQVLAVKEQLKDLGFVTKEDQSAELDRTKEDLQLGREIDNLSAKYDGKDGRPKFDRDKVLDYALENKVGDLDAAYRLMNEKKLTDWHIKQATGKTKGIKSETSTGTGKTTAGTTDADLKEAAKGGDKDALHTFLKRRAAFAQKRK